MKTTAFIVGVLASLAFVCQPVVSASAQGNTNYGMANRLALGTANLILPGVASNASIVLADTLANPAWSATANSSWLHLCSGSQSGQGSQNVIFAYDANPGLTRTGSITIAGLTATITQAPSNYSAAQTISNFLPALPYSYAAEGVAIDSHGNAYFTDYINDTIWEWVAASQTLTNLNPAGLSDPGPIAADGVGNLYFIDYTSPFYVVKERRASDGSVTNLFVAVDGGYDYAAGIAVDAVGNVYEDDYYYGNVKEWFAASQTVSNLAGSFSQGAGALAIDGAGDLYSVNEYNGNVQERLASTGAVSTLPIGGVSYASDVQVDAAGNLFIVDSGNNGVIDEWSPSTQTTTAIVSPYYGASYLALDGNDDIFYAGSGPFALYEWSSAAQTNIPLADGTPILPFSFAVDSSNDLYMANYYEEDVNKWSPASNTCVPLFSALSMNPSAVALDANGNVYFTDTVSNLLYESGPNGENLTILASNLNYPTGVAVDAAGNVYVVENGNNDVLEYNPGTANLIQYVPSLAGLNGPYQVAIDAAGNLYIADNNNSRIVEWNSQSLSNVISLQYPNNVTVDGSGNVYSADDNNNVFEYQAASGLVVQLGIYSVGNAGLGVGPTGDLFYISTNTYASVELPNAFLLVTNIVAGPVAGSVNMPPIVPTNLSLPAGLQPGSSQPWFTSSATNGVMTVALQQDEGATRNGVISFLGWNFNVTQLTDFNLGTTNLVEGPNAGSDSVLIDVGSPPDAWTAYSTASWLHVSQSGTASSTVVFSFDSNTNAEGSRCGVIMIASQPVMVTQAAVGYLAATSPATPLVSSNLDNPQGVALDSYGDIYIADSSNNAVEQWNFSQNTVSTVINSGLRAPHGVALDAFGNIYVADTGNNSLKEFSSGGQLITNLTFSAPEGIAVDPLGNVYIAETDGNDVQRWNPNTQSIGNLGVSGLSAPAGVAVDISGNVYIADTGHNAIKEWFSSKNAVVTLVTGLNAPQGVAVDGRGDVCIADTGNNAVKVWSPVNGLSTIVSTGLNSPRGVAVDSAGDAFIADTLNNAVEEMPRAFAQPASFYFTNTAASAVLPVIVPPSSAFSLPQFLPASDSSWITVTGVTNGVASFNVATLSTPNRTGHITELGVVSTIDQTPSYYLGSSTLLEGPAAGVDTVVLSVTPEVGLWTATANSSWLHVAATNQSGVGSTNFFFSYDTNTGPTRTGTIIVAGQTLTVQQAGSTYVATPLNNTVLISNGIVDVEGIGVDSLGNVFVANSYYRDIAEWTPNNNGVSENYVGYGPGFVVPDNSGGVYFVDEDDDYLLHENSSGNVSILSSGLQNLLIGLAEDRFGNLYISQLPGVNNGTYLGLISEWSPSTSSLTNVLPSIYYNLGVAVDVAGNLYIADANYINPNNGEHYGCLQKWTAATGQLSTLLNENTDGGFEFPSAVAVDGSGNVYYTDPELGRIAVWTAATGQLSALLSVPYSDTAGGAFGIAVDAQRNVYYSDSDNEVVGEIARAYVDPTAKSEGPAAGSDVLPTVLPATENLLAPFAPSSDQPWLSVNSVNNGIVAYGFFANPTPAPRVAHITLLGETITVTQAGIPPTLLNLSFVGPGTFQLGITNVNTNGTYTVLTTTNLEVPLTNWTVLGLASNVGAGLMQFTDTQATNTTRFYTVRSP